MAATYSAFMTTRFYSPVFNTALFDGPLRIYFSQSYESVALKIYHLLQTQYPELWARLKLWSTSTQDHVFLLIYPEVRDLQIIFDQVDDLQSSEYLKKNQAVRVQAWEEGLALGISQPETDIDVVEQMEQIEKHLNRLLAEESSSYDSLQI